MFSSLLIANRGEIACRIIKTAKRLGIRTVAVYSDADARALHVRMADEAVHIGPSPATQSYLSVEKIIAAARRTGAEAVHPGYGFLSENPAFAKACAEVGIIFVGPPVAAIEAMGDKITSKRIAAEAGVSTVPGHMGLIETADEAARIAGEIGYPVMLKASAGGGGKGMRIAWNKAEAREGFDRARSEARSSFGDDRIFVEKFVTEPRHIEIQVLGDQYGNIIHLGERECSIQRRNQKVIEEAPSPFLDAETRAHMGAQAVALAKAVGYQSAGTVEFIVDRDRKFYFLEMNTRLQVEHPVTELVTGLDLVELMLRIAAGESLPLAQDGVRRRGWAIESRIYAEDPYRNFLPSTGRLTRYRPAKEQASEALVIRNDTGADEGDAVSTFYDPMIAKLCSWAPTRESAINAMAQALDRFEIEGVGHNLPFLSTVMDQPRFREGRLTTAYIAEEFPEGFLGPTLTDDLLLKVVALADFAGRLHEARAGQEPRGTRSIIIEERRWEVGEGEFDVRSEWRPGLGLIEAVVKGEPVVARIQRRSNGFRLRLRGADLEVKVLRPEVADLLRFNPQKTPPDLSRFLLCPMPGQLARLEVEEGQVVENGQALAIVEAMKMENVLRAEKRARVAKIRVAVGAVLAVDEVILEFKAE